MYFVIRDVVGGYRGRRSAGGGSDAARDLGHYPAEFAVVVSVYADQGGIPELDLWNIVLADVDDGLYPAHIGDAHHFGTGHHGVADDSFAFFDTEQADHTIDR